MERYVQVLINLGGIGGIFRNGDGHPVGLFSKPLSGCLVIEAELEAIFFALLVLRSRKNTYNGKVMILSDSSVAIAMLESKEDAPQWVLDLIMRVELLLSNFIRVELKHIRREENTDADYLSKSGIGRAQGWVAWL